jgi:flagellar protein FlaG
MDVGSAIIGGQNNFSNISLKNETISPSKADVNTMAQKSDTDTQNNSDTNGKVNEADVKKAITKLNGFLKSDNTEIQYQYHSVFRNDLMIKIVNKDTNEVILEVPPKQILDLVAKMCEMVGILFDKKA